MFGGYIYLRYSLGEQLNGPEVGTLLLYPPNVPLGKSVHKTKLKLSMGALLSVNVKSALLGARRSLVLTGMQMEISVCL